MEATSHKQQDINADTINRAYTIAEAATALRMSDKSVRRLIARRHLRRCRVFGRILIPSKDVETFFERYATVA